MQQQHSNQHARNSNAVTWYSRQSVGTREHSWANRNLSVVMPTVVLNAPYRTKQQICNKIPYTRNELHFLCIPKRKTLTVRTQTGTNKVTNIGITNFGIKFQRKGSVLFQQLMTTVNQGKQKQPSNAYTAGSFKCNTIQTAQKQSRGVRTIVIKSVITKGRNLWTSSITNFESLLYCWKFILAYILYRHTFFMVWTGGRYKSEEPRVDLSVRPSPIISKWIFCQILIKFRTGFPYK
jgi:hypothetical protein